MGYCGSSSEGIQLLIHGTINQCLFDTVASLALVLILCIIGYNQYNRIKVLERSNRFQATPPAAWQTHLSIGLCFTLSLTHALAIIFLFGTSSGPAPYVIFSYTLFSIVWALAGLSYFWSDRLSLRTLAYSAAVMYLFLLYSQIQLYISGAGITPAERKINVGLVGTLFILAASYAAIEYVKLDKEAIEEEDVLLRQALLSDIEQQESQDGKPHRKRSWVSLLGIAASYMWPTGLWLQVRATFCVTLVVLLRLLNLAVPFLYKRVVDEFSAASIDAQSHALPFKTVFYPWVCLYLVAYFFQGGSGGTSGLISNLRSYLWIPISQASYRRATLDVFTHALGMDLDFHLKRKTGELLRVMDRGTNSIQTLLSTVVFSVGPAIFDIAAASVYIAISLQPWIAVVVFITLSTYIPMTIALTEWRGQFRREMNRLDNAKSARATDALLNYETVKLFNNEELEADNFAKAIDDYQVMDYRLWSSMNALNVAQSLIIFSGLAAGLSVCTSGIAQGHLTVGDAVLFVTLMQQLYAPLNFFGSYYRMIQQSVIDMESMFDLLATSPGLQDSPNAVALNTSSPLYSVHFENVFFNYRGEGGAPVLKGISFDIEGGHTVALVGSTGAGKSTILRLLFRFYDPTAGIIRVNDQDISKVTQSSLRTIFAVVPQDTVLFNDTIRNNIRYGRPSASDEDVEEAAEAACIHETITQRFPLGYETIVGERGLRLSGGEKQRVAFARAILKNPQILILDEATSALDSLTERKIQSALAERRENRTVVMVAHRLSTVMDADRIIVLKEGLVEEYGTHEELIHAHGLYKQMWDRQRETGGGTIDELMDASSSAKG